MFKTIKQKISNFTNELEAKIDNSIKENQTKLDVKNLAYDIYHDNNLYFTISFYLSPEFKNKLDDLLFEKYNLVFDDTKYLSSKK